MNKLLKAAICTTVVIGGWSVNPAGPVFAADEGVCTSQSSGKVDVSGSHTTLTFTAPAGQLISGYCVKAGSVVQGDGPEYVTVDPPAAKVTISHSSGKDISHYSLLYVEDTLPPVDVCSNINGDQTVIPDGMTATYGICTEIETDPPVDVCSNINGDQTVIPDGMTATYGICTEIETDPPVDVCANIDGTQSTVPAGMTATDGVCTTMESAPPVAADVCANIDGTQTMVPVGSVVSDGDCVQESAAGPVPPAVTQTPAPAAQVLAAAAQPASPAAVMLPATGARSSLFVAVAAALLLAGFGALGFSRRRLAS